MWGGRRFFFQHVQKGWEWEGGEETRVLPPQFRSSVKERGTLPGSPVPEVRCASPSAIRSKEKVRGRRLVHTSYPFSLGVQEAGFRFSPRDCEGHKLYSQHQKTNTWKIRVLALRAKGPPGPGTRRFRSGRPGAPRVDMGRV